MNVAKLHNSNVLTAIDLPALGVVCDTRLFVARLDKLEVSAPGNKRFKLEPNLEAARSSGKEGLLSFGGCWSNHLHALAYAGATAGFRTYGLVRGEKSAKPSAMITDVLAAGMELEFVNRAEYRRRHDPDYLIDLRRRYPDCWIIPEGGANAQGARGCMAIAQLVHDAHPDVGVIATACGTGTTLAGLAAAGVCEVRGYSVLRDGGSIADRVDQLLAELGEPEPALWSVRDNCHGGGYARLPAAYRELLLRFEAVTDIPIDPVYTTKLVAGLLEDLAGGCYAGVDSVVALHGGGLQGRRGFTWLEVASRPG